MKSNLPYLNKERLNAIFDEVYGYPETGTRAYKDERIQDLADTLLAMQRFNYQHRPDDTGALFSLMSTVFNFEKNSEGTTLWLSLILAVKELYGFDSNRLIEVMKTVSVRK